VCVCVCLCLCVCVCLCTREKERQREGKRFFVCVCVRHPRSVLVIPAQLTTDTVVPHLHPPSHLSLSFLSLSLALSLSLFGVAINRPKLKGVDLSLIPVLVVKALGIEETVGYN